MALADSFGTRAQTWATTEDAELLSEVRYELVPRSRAIRQGRSVAA
jgi:hypothetical protein